jgi:hypothetical protein
MTALTMLRRRIEQTGPRPSWVRPPAAWADLIPAASAVLRRLVVTVGVITAGATSLGPAHADPPNGSAGAALGQSICPMLVKPGATLASIASQLTGSTGLSPGMAGFVATLAIQTQCPSFMQSLANGKMPFPLQSLGANTPLSILGQPPGAGPVPAIPLLPLGH